MKFSPLIFLSSALSGSLAHANDQGGARRRLRPQGSPPNSPQGSNVRVIIAYNNDQGRQDVLNAAENSNNVHADLTQDKLIAVTIPASKADDMQANNPNIDMVEPDAEVYPAARPNKAGGNTTPNTVFENSPSDGDPHLVQVTPYGIPMTQADEELPHTQVPPEEFRICIIDDGIDADHEDLKDNNMMGEGFDLDPGQTWNNAQGSHGTHVAGTIAAVDNSIGVVGVEGDAVGNNITLLIASVFAESRRGTYTSTLLKAANWCAENNARVISMSLGGISQGEPMCGVGGDLEEIMQFCAVPKTSSARVFRRLYREEGILSFASAGNSDVIGLGNSDEHANGSTHINFPAGDNHVVSVAAVDALSARAPFSQVTSQNEIAAPGVAVLSTVPEAADFSWTTIFTSSQTIVGYEMEYAGSLDQLMGLYPLGIVNCNLAETSSDCVGGAVGKACLIQRGTFTFRQKVESCEAAGGVFAIIYNNVDGAFGGTLQADPTTSIPAMSISDTDGEALVAALLDNPSETIDDVSSVGPLLYVEFDGTSMAAPHASGIAAKVWSRFPQCTNSQIRLAMQNTAKDLGAEGHDFQYGFGLIQAKNMYDYIDGTLNGCM